ncbi:50S ribosomal protein L29 [Candidatus Woesebacteria bacterium RBG_16_36_11]|uniref:Large ribosomal subunit protein uL29 n=3 Tax=Candidatus Woeseibacteriota TaxID=1752722 RepID=A0A1F7XBD0_9BACT|nr:MAG: 50S ribosomal protein L29 [Candidatus Woesebacteria bacterium RBG_13_36_22]OGM12344.1 MAG: 50S ribosomal protein L29 [Candidatus Woesebacteria bacterium RBG_16_36_11]OGM17237.1 MAG: 50S ribosomal protein L29 [Candidatus Woesebacteria bacterium RBG_19FT_COMBO_37_29]
MKKKDFESLKEKNISDLKKMVFDKKKETSLLFAKTKAGQEKNTSKMRNIKREIARILTLITEKEIIEKEKDK